MRLFKIIDKILNYHSVEFSEGVLAKELGEYFTKIFSLSNLSAQKFKHKKSEEKFILGFSKFIKKELEPKLFEGLELTIKKSAPIEKCIEFLNSENIENLYSIYSNIEKALLKVFEDKLIKDEIVVFASKSSSFTIHETSNLISKALHYVIHHDWHDWIKEIVENHIYEAINQCHNKDGLNALQVACLHGNLKVAKKLIEYGLKNEKIGDTLSPLEIAQSNGHKELAEFLSIHALKESPQKQSKGLIALMGAATSPAKRITLSGTTLMYEDAELPAKLQHTLRPSTLSTEGNNLVAITPFGSRALPACDIIVTNFDSHGHSTSQVITLFMDEGKAYNKRAIRDKEIPISSPPEGLPLNTKIDNKGYPLAISTTLTVELYKKWNPKPSKSSFKKKKRYRDQKRTMVYSAQNLASNLGFEADKNHRWQWCHLLAYSMGGEDGQKPKTKAAADYVGPQRERNLVVGTVEANAQMSIIEGACKKLIYSKPSIFIQARPKFVEGLEAFHIAESVQYTLQDEVHEPKRQITFIFDMLTRRKITSQESAIVEAVIIKYFNAPLSSLRISTDNPFEAYTTPVKAKSLSKQPFDFDSSRKRVGLFNPKKERDKAALIMLEAYLSKAGYIIGAAFSEGDCFFDAIAQGLEKANITITPSETALAGYKKLRLICDQHAKNKQDAEWIKELVEKDGGCNYQDYLATVRYTAEEMKKFKNENNSFNGIAVWGRQHIEGRIICQALNIKLHLVEVMDVEGAIILNHQLIDATGARTIGEKKANESYSDLIVMHLSVYQHSLHFVPLLKNSKPSNENSLIAELPTSSPILFATPTTAQAKEPPSPFNDSSDRPTKKLKF